jgi:predicted nucleotidyltransferase
MPESNDLRDLAEILHQQLPLLNKRYGLRSLSLFGSYVRDEQRLDSDLDLLVTFDDPPSLLKFIEMENYLSDLLGVKVDLVLEDTLKAGIRERILNELVPV